MHPDGVEPLVEPLEFEPAPAAAEAPPLPAAEAPLCPHPRRPSARTRGAPLPAQARETGGSAFTPRHGSDVTSALAQIARDLRSGYTIGFAPRDTGESGYRSIRVVADAGDGRPLVVRTRTGYYATLITCCPFWLLGNAPERFVVRATRVRSAAAAPVAPTTPRFGMVDDPYGPHAAESAARELAVAQR